MLSLSTRRSVKPQIIGPAFGGLAIGLVGLGAVYVVNGLFYLFAMLALIAVHVPAPVRPETIETPWRSFLDGLIFVRRKRVIVWLMTLDIAATVLGNYRALLPIFATNLGVGAGGFGLLSAAPGIGALTGSALMLSLGDIRYRGLYAIAAVFSYCGALALLAVSPWFPMAMLAAAGLGLTDSIQMIARNSTIIGISPDELRSRVEAFRSMIAGGGTPLGYTLSGAFAASFGAPIALIIGAFACMALVTTIALTRKELRDPRPGFR